jgi:nitroreductase
VKEKAQVNGNLRGDIKRLYKLIIACVLRLFAGRKLLIHLYYSFFSGAFRKEQQAVLYGRMVYSKKARRFQNHYLLRRNIHRLEKGLINVPRRSIFGVDYINETVCSYQQLVDEYSQENLYKSEVQWAYDVLNQYFAITTSHPVIDKAKDQFMVLGKPFENNISFAPFKREHTSPPPVTYTALQELAKWRKSVRRYQLKAVPRNLIDQAITVAGLAPSACNRQPFEFRIFDDPKLVKEIASLPVGMTGFSETIPVIVVVIGRLRAFEGEHDRHVIYIDGALASMTFMLTLETLGLSSCPVNWPDIKQREQKMANLIGLAPDERPIIIITLGYPDPDGLVAYSQRKPLGELRRYNE